MKVKIGRFPKGGSQKIDIQIDEFDTWNLDRTLALIIYPALIQLREEKQGVPHDFSVVGGEDWDQQYCFDFYTESHNEAFEEKVKQWNIVLDKMIWSFEQIINDNDDMFHYGKYRDFKTRKINKTMVNPITGKTEELYELVDPTPSSHYFDADGYTMYHNRIQEGLELFGKYYRSLWD